MALFSEEEALLNKIITIENITTQENPLIGPDGLILTQYLPNGGGGGVSILNDLVDVSLSVPLAGQTLSYTGAQWTNANLNMEAIGDYTTSNLQDGDVITYDINSDTYTNKPVATTISGLTDTNISSLATNQKLVFNGINWVNVNDLDVVISGTPQEGHIKMYNSTLGQFSVSKFLNIGEIRKAGSSAVLFDEPVGASDKDSFLYNATNGVFQSRQINTGDINDISITAPTNGQILKYNSITSKWTNATEEFGEPIDNPVADGQLRLYSSITTKFSNNRFLYMSDIRSFEDDSILFFEPTKNNLDVFIFSSVDNKFESRQLTLNDISGFNVVEPITTGSILRFNGVEWIKSTNLNTLEIIIENHEIKLNNLTHADLTDTNITNPIGGDVLRYNAVSAKWENDPALQAITNNLNVYNIKASVYQVAMTEGTHINFAVYKDVHLEPTPTINKTTNGDIVINPAIAPTTSLGVFLKAGTYQINIRLWWRNLTPYTGALGTQFTQMTARLTNADQSIIYQEFKTQYTEEANSSGGGDGQNRNIWLDNWTAIVDLTSDATMFLKIVGNTSTSELETTDPTRNSVIVLNSSNHLSRMTFTKLNAQALTGNDLIDITTIENNISTNTTDIANIEITLNNLSHADLQDTNIINPVAGDVLRFNNVSSKWENDQILLDQLVNISAEPKTDNSIIYWDNTNSEWRTKQEIGGVSNLDGLVDVSLTSPAIGKYLGYDSAQWIDKFIDYSEIINRIVNINDLSDVVINLPSSGQIIQYNGTQWVNASQPAQTLSGLIDTTITSPANGESLVYNGSVWVNQIVSGGGGTLTSAGGTETLISDPNLVLKGLTAGNTGITLSSDTAQVNITNAMTITSAGGTTMVSGNSVFPNYQIKGLTAGTGISLGNAITAITINLNATTRTLTDVSTTTPSNDNILIYNNTTSTYVPSDRLALAEINIDNLNETTLFLTTPINTDNTNTSFTTTFNDLDTIGFQDLSVPTKIKAINVFVSPNMTIANLQNAINQLVLFNTNAGIGASTSTSYRYGFDYGGSVEMVQYYYQLIHTPSTPAYVDRAVIHGYNLVPSVNIGDYTNGTLILNDLGINSASGTAVTRNLPASPSFRYYTIEFYMTRSVGTINFATYAVGLVRAAGGILPLVLGTDFSIATATTGAPTITKISLTANENIKINQASLVVREAYSRLFPTIRASGQVNIGNNFRILQATDFYIQNQTTSTNLFRLTQSGGSLYIPNLLSNNTKDILFYNQADGSITPSDHGTITSGEYLMSDGLAWTPSGLKIAIGNNNANAPLIASSGANSISIGNSCPVSTGINSISIGYLSKCSFDNSIVLNNSGLAYDAQATSSVWISTLRGRTGIAGDQNVIWNSTTGELCYDTSSSKYKIDITESLVDTSSITNARLVSYKAKRDPSLNYPIGVIAEELYDINPILTTTDKEGNIEGVNYNMIVLFLLGEIKRMKECMVCAQRDIANLKANAGMP